MRRSFLSIASMPVLAFAGQVAELKKERSINTERRSPSVIPKTRYDGAAIREANRRNGVGRPPRNKVWPKGHPKAEA